MLIDANTSFGLPLRERRDLSLETLLALLERHGVDLALTYSLRGVEYDFVSGNTETLGVCARHPMLLPVATVHPGRHCGCADELRRCAGEGCVAVRFFPDRQGWPILYQPFLDLCELAAELSLPVILPAGGPGQQTLIAERLGPLGLRVLIVGSGYGSNSETAAVLKKCRGFYMESHLVDTPGTLEYLGRVAGFDRLVFGSAIPDRVFEAAQYMGRYAAFTDEQRAGFFGGNVLRFLGRAD